MGRRLILIDRYLFVRKNSEAGGSILPFEVQHQWNGVGKARGGLRGKSSQRSAGLDVRVVIVTVSKHDRRV